jgi:phosphatidylinositol alpha-mannosyltransferase
MKIALVSPYDFAQPGGVTAHVSALRRHFRSRGHRVRVLAPYSADAARMPPYLIRASGSVQSVAYGGAVARISLSPRIYRRVKRVLRQEQFDVIHLHEPLSPGLSLMVLRHLGVSPRSLAVGTFHAYQETSKGYAIGKPLLKRFFDRLDGRIAVSEAARDYVARYFPASYALIPNGIDLERFGDPGVQPLEPYMDGRMNLLFVGRLEERKGFAHLLRAFARVQAALPETRLLVVGAFSPKDAAPYIRESRALGLKRVRFVGPVSDEALPRYYRSCHLFCAPSIGYESFGLVLLEAMAAGAPVVATDIRGYRAVLAGGRTGELVPPGDVPALAAAIIQLLRDPTRREKLIRRGKNKARAYDWCHVTERILQYYHQLHGQQRPAPRKGIDEWEVKHARG